MIINTDSPDDHTTPRQMGGKLVAAPVVGLFLVIDFSTQSKVSYFFCVLPEPNTVPAGRSSSRAGAEGRAPAVAFLSCSLPPP
mmetsp:Transcript_31462/g.43805  ORF Transcript_31462/g.43805 Transcript_31462/m.43805 type:complete len:83 (-) Transcript_31462:264-512(-)